MNLVKDHEDLKEWNTKSNDNNERRLIENENHELKTSLKTVNFLERKRTGYKFNNWEFHLSATTSTSKQKQMVHREKKNNALTKQERQHR